MTTASKAITNQDYSFVLYKKPVNTKALQSQIGSPYDECICLMLIQKNTFYHLCMNSVAHWYKGGNP